MIARVIAVVAGLSGGAVTSQFPEFSQQYLQRLSGAVEELGRVVADFDASAAASGLSRAEALDSLEGSPFLERRRADMTRSFTRHAQLTADLAELENASVYQRALQPARFMDGDVAAAAYETFKPAVPLTTEGAVFAGGGFVAGWGGVAVMLAALGGLFRRLFRRKPVTDPT